MADPRGCAMNRIVSPGMRRGRLTVPASKSAAHRFLICAALSAAESTLLCDGVSQDIAATMDCLNALGADIACEGAESIRVRPIRERAAGVKQLFCRESGSTLRFLLPVLGALGESAVFHMAGRLPERPLAPLDALLVSRGQSLRKEGALLACSGRLQAGEYRIAADVSSQYISGLLLALPLLSADSELILVGKRESAPYIAMTESALRHSGICVEKTADGYHIRGGQQYRLSGSLRVERDWSSAAFPLCLGALSADGISLAEMDLASAQGDKQILDILAGFGARVETKDGLVCVRKGSLRGQRIDAAQIPDLVPVISVVAAVAEGETRIVNAGRLRLKESDRIRTTAAMLRALGGEAAETADGLVIKGKPCLHGGFVDPAGDHRIAMAAAVAAAACKEVVTVKDPECVAKSYPRFWADLDALEMI